MKPPLRAIVTGASGGIGEAVAARLLAAGCEVTLVARAGSRLEAARSRLAGLATADRIRAVGADLSLQADVRRLAGDLSASRIDILVLNAALMPGERRLTAEGVEETLAVNHLAPFLLTCLLVRSLGPCARVVVVGADPRLLAREPVDLDDLSLARGFTPVRAYMRTKNMNAMFAYALARRLGLLGHCVSAAHPGVIRTELGRHSRGLLGLALAAARPFLPGPETGADTPAWLATVADAHACHGRFFVKRRVVATAPHTLDQARQETLWRTSAALVGIPSEF